MPQIEAFRGIRYDLGHVGSLSDVIAPPYDVIDKEFQDALYKKHPANVIRLELNREEPGDDDTNNRYVRAAKFLKDWRSQGVMFSEGAPAVYVYHQVFEYAGQKYVRRGFMARIKLEKFGEGTIYPHEETHANAKADRLMLTRACKANISQIFGIYPDAKNAAQEVLENFVADKTALECTDHLGVLHRLWPVSDVQVISKVQGLVGGKPVFIADGHHRYETALNYREELSKAGPLPSNHPAHSVLMMLIGMDDPGLIVLPTHRLFRGLPEMSSETFGKALGDCFTTKVVGEGSDLAENVWEEIETEGDQGQIGFYTAKDQRWVLARITPAGKKRMAELSTDHSADWQGLGVAILQRLVLENLLKATNLPKAHYVHLVQELVDGVETGEFALSALVMPATVQHIQAISSHLERMPAKSTYFYPKLLSGLVINPLE
jgi:uncharacterized protein (DUF1015 family)